MNGFTSEGWAIAGLEDDLGANAGKYNL